MASSIAPPGTGPFPAVVFEHGGEQEPGNMIDEAQFFVPHGFVMFAPHRRGQGRSARAAEYTERGVDLRQQEPRATRRPARHPGRRRRRRRVSLRAAHLPFVDPNRVALAGCSFGGIERFSQQSVTSVCAPRLISGGGHHVVEDASSTGEDETRGPRGATVPVLFVQAENDFNTTPSHVLRSSRWR